MTIGLICRQLGTERQYIVLQRADVLFSESVGRYFGGYLTLEQVAYLTEGFK
jgi:hypothetical protein